MDTTDETIFSRHPYTQNSTKWLKRNQRLEVIIKVAKKYNAYSALTFQKNPLPPSSWHVPSFRAHHLPLVCPVPIPVFHIPFLLLHSKWRQKVPPKCWYTHYKASSHPRCSCSKFHIPLKIVYADKGIQFIHQKITHTK